MAAATANTAASSEAWPVVAVPSAAGELPAGLPSDDPVVPLLDESPESLLVPVGAALATEVSVVDAARSRDSDAVADWVRTAVVSEITALETTVPLAVPLGVAAGVVVVGPVPRSVVGMSTLKMAVGELSPLPSPVGLAFAVDVGPESLEPLEPVSKPAFASASARALSGILHWDLMGLMRSSNLVSDEHHWFIHITTSDRNEPLTFPHMQSMSVGGHPFCRTQLVMQVGY